MGDGCGCYSWLGGKEGRKVEGEGARWRRSKGERAKRVIFWGGEWLKEKMNPEKHTRKKEGKENGEGVCDLVGMVTKKIFCSVGSG